MLSWNLFNNLGARAISTTTGLPHVNLCSLYVHIWDNYEETGDDNRVNPLYNGIHYNIEILYNVILIAWNGYIVLDMYSL